MANPVRFAHEGIDALDMLRGTNGRVRLPRPFLLLLDLSMPPMDGIEFLQELRHDEELKRSIVFVLTTSNAREDNPRLMVSALRGYLPKAGLMAWPRTNKAAT